LVDRPNSPPHRNTRSPIKTAQNNSTTFDVSTTPQRNTLLHGNGANDLPPPNSVEIVHVGDKKKKCACCRLQ
jgi:hypothetical protein